MDAQRKLLDALMGADRNGGAVQKHFTDKDVCKHYLCGMCPHDQFVNTKNDLGPCPKAHSAPLKLEYEEARKKTDYGYERDLEGALQRLVNECDNRITKGLKRIEDQEAATGIPDMAEALTKEIAECIRKAEELAEQGKVEECKELYARAETLKQQKASALATSLLGSMGKPGEEVQSVNIAGVSLPPGVSGTNQIQKLRVCDICASLLSLYDSDRRLADHFGGKLHIGYLNVREKLKELKALREKSGAAAPAARSSAERDRDSHRESHRDSRDRRDDRRDSHRDRDRDRDSRDRDRNTDKDRDRDRPRDRNRDRRDDKDDGKRQRRD